MMINTILYGATGMIGSGVLIECLQHSRVKSILVIGRTSCKMDHPKLREVLLTDFMDYSKIEDELTGYNAFEFPLHIQGILPRAVSFSLNTPTVAQPDHR